mmetsp:Transcript_61098/g.157551  ORF Transcript_61098/g.157551 Transcript_61098/m.157551 type:complete len:498 (-) Transcript_61098:44-1537(-)|eukprot:CAMPEP_0195068600 /NCGR_PEP_ID=MMETSP0448-20130528/13249_1 /TAXON_ID=66468 /ORGANISM="Heterocapsa triquestra, Strain CCMP 448" /LENGTH=497 /DNA_ID=CAMNT_0040100139 /DNA_START=130 /DNA_END=1623 /DNA_ORIENTATION=+
MNGWKDADGTINFDHPRTLAAMKVTGITEADIVTKSKEPGLDQTPPRGGQTPRVNSEGLARRNEVWEQKRQHLLKELEEIAETLEEREVESLLSPRPAHAVDVQDWFDRQKSQVDRMRGRLRTQLQKDAQREIQKQQAQDIAMRDRDAVQRRLQEQAAEKKAFLQEQAEKRATQQAKVLERLKASAKAEKERRDGITSRLSSDMDRVTKLVEGRRGDLANKAQGVHSRTAEISDRKAQHEQSLLEEKLRRVDEAVQKDQMVEERLQQSHHETLQKFEERRGKFSNKMYKVQETLAQQELEREKQFRDSLEKLENCRKTALEETQKVVDSTKEARDKRMNRWATTRQTQRTARREYLKELKTTMNQADQKSETVREKYLEETIYDKAANRGLFHEVVEQNKQRIARSDEYARAHTLAKIEREMARTQAIEAHKKTIMENRCSAIKESMLGRIRVEELKSANKDAGEASLKRVNNILRDLDMPPLSTAPVNQGEEGQQQ